MNRKTPTGKRSGDAIQVLMKIAEKVLPQGYTYEFSGTRKQEIETGNKSSFVLVLSLLFIFFLLLFIYDITGIYNLPYYYLYLLKHWWIF
ncbi:MAG: efflux RND transporter permease subunit [Flavobacteriales bacterium AspAUS03]